MMDRPTARELVEAVREFLETKAMPALSGHTAFHARVAVNALAIVSRELELGQDADQREHKRLRQLLNQDGTLDTLNRALCEQLRDGRMALDTPGLAEHLRLSIRDKVEIDQPTYSGLKTALQAEAKRD